MNISEPFADTDLCVKCGLCLPHCPTYGQTLDENESPRGRLALIQGWASGNLQTSPKLLGHLDNCLLCRTCEAVCPAKVPYGRLMDEFRGRVTSIRPLPARLKSGLVRNLLRRRPLLQRLAGSSLRSWARSSGLLRLIGVAELETGLPDSGPPQASWHGTHLSSGRETARVGLFLGCTAELADAETVAATIRLLNRLGVTVVVPQAQGCCGALALHAGERREATHRLQANIEAFAHQNLDTVVSIASGCGATLKEYPVLDGSERTAVFSRKVEDVCQYVQRIPWTEPVPVRPLRESVWLHTPCSLNNVLRARHHPLALLRRIPGLEVRELPDIPACCGAAGSYMLEHPQTAGRLRDQLIEPLATDEPTILVTSNVGCALHLRSGLRKKGRNSIRVIHPVALLERQISAD